MNLLNDLSSSVKLPDLGFNNFLVFSTWAYKDDIQATEDGEWPGFGEKAGSGELELLSEYVARVNLSIWVSWLHTCFCRGRQGDGEGRGEATRDLIRKYGSPLACLFTKLPESCLLLFPYSLQSHPPSNLSYFLLSKALVCQLSYKSQYLRTRWCFRVIRTSSPDPSFYR